MNKKERILHAALELLTTNGVHATPMSAIANKAGTGMGTIYNYFPNKEVLINAIYQKIKIEEEVLFDVFDANAPIRTQFENYYTKVVKFFLQHEQYFKFMDQLQASPIIAPESREVGLKSIIMVHQLIEKGKQDLILKDIATSDLLQFMAGSILSFLRTHFNSKATNASQKALKNQLQMTWDAIKA
ncbi:TetR/AcrR family transcriptional regulator [Flavobacterium sp. ASW18X]|uniref:TetR/AcrR family transcriptional regulator n=1 Tax=Flavobacterium sp. ASW18X TaxID=2572595 RepID=UPI0010AE4F89|nr:TetR/AcrR family transcriptional regulator [Flavobacterium sp. ASW18X]TKD62516.1 TetR/AcrR family transcriptional regulator [Flavobacterium sp. ASW18X]